MLNKGILVFVALFFLFSCGTEPQNEEETNSKTQDEAVSVTEINWPTGNFVDTTVFRGRVHFCENWKMIGEGAWEGEKYQIQAGDTSSSTQLSLTKTDGKYYYSILEEESQITFVQDSINEGYLSFVNTQDNFPTNLIYRWENDNLIISFSGFAKGVFRDASFNTYKVKD